MDVRAFGSRMSASNPVLLFLGLFENAKEDFENVKDFSHLANPYKPLEITLKNTKEFRSNIKERKGLNNVCFPGFQRPDKKFFTPDIHPDIHLDV